MIYTIGHSILSTEQFLKVIEPVDIVMDVRSHPGSKWEQFNKENLEKWLPENNKKYIWEPRLGGWSAKHLTLIEQFSKYNVDIAAYAKSKFPKQRIAKNNKPSDVPTWYNQGLWDYQFFMTLPEFVDGINNLLKISDNANVGIT